MTVTRITSNSLMMARRSRSSNPLIRLPLRGYQQTRGPIQAPIASSPEKSQFKASQQHERISNVQRRQYLSWLNPFSKNAGVRDASAIVGSTRTKTEDEADQPRKLQERKDLILLMLALEFHKIAADHDHKSSSSEAQYFQNREAMIDKAFDRLEEMEIDNKSMMQLRYSLQEAMEEQVIDLFHAFGSIDEELLLLLPGNDDTEKVDQPNIEAYLDEILRLELERTIDELANSNQHRAPKGADPKFFLTLKRGAIERLLDKSESSSSPETNQTNSNNDVHWSDADEFGYHASIDEERNRLIRYYQSINMCRAAKLRDKQGYSVVAMRSSLPGAGRGVYVDGYARAGSILAFQPGPVWAKENLVNLSVEEERDLERNDAYQMSLRADDFMIDSRRSPYTVLTDENSNQMAIGHIVNHPSPSNPPSCRSAMLNFTQSMGLGSSATLKRYIPNTYARPRNVTLMDSLWDRDVVEMHSLVLIATRDICNEEIFYDYRLASSHLPSWYHPVSDTAYETVETSENESSDNNNDDDQEKEDKLL